MSRLARDGANGDREILIFPVQLTTSRVGNLSIFCDRLNDDPVGPVVQLVTSKHSDTLEREFESRYSNWDFSALKIKCRTSGSCWNEKLIR